MIQHDEAFMTYLFDFPEIIKDLNKTCSITKFIDQLEQVKIFGKQYINNAFIVFKHNNDIPINSSIDFSKVEDELNHAGDRLEKLLDNTNFTGTAASLIISIRFFFSQMAKLTFIDLKKSVTSETINEDLLRIVQYAKDCNIFSSEKKNIVEFFSSSMPFSIIARQMGHNVIVTDDGLYSKTYAQAHEVISKQFLRSIFFGKNVFDIHIDRNSFINALRIKWFPNKTHLFFAGATLALKFGKYDESINNYEEASIEDAGNFLLSCINCLTEDSSICMRHFSFFDGYDQKTQEILFEKLNHWLEEKTKKP